jgi:sarcosine oxidase, subunit gamma
MADLMDERGLQPRSALDGLALQTISGVVSVRAARPCHRFALRGDAAALSAALDIEMPSKPLTSTIHTDRVVLWLGPDEWLLLDTASGNAPAKAPSSTAYAIIDVTHRSTGLVIEGPRAADLLAAACPLDLDPAAYPSGMCTRTLFAKAEIVLFRPAPQTFHLDIWQSFAPYVVGVLNEAMRDIIQTTI